MSQEKRPLHEVLSHKLIFAPIGIAEEMKRGELMTILDTLRQGKMKAADAHKIAEDHAGLPELLKSAGKIHLAQFAQEVLDDLAGRQDEKKQEKTEEVVDTVVHG
ncbi:MAG: hypothetical protein A2758_02970 [Candidatus Zambryskibacteria bacterium RIFCSPHIGHO2_01_FULL_49_18]|uniref:Uncharacterized protein n=2 Tax=Candidatus Zambryskiibacteriota TaxID=1817925 RepID=A0A1G2T284_9BACT|nr:MAG: hypothetical protein A2758_02970 [Candidatus Zambryskibacteria bacterium RIFCSPHIGHO2_01_FULL_49_18]OHB05036.1 MAG: hypothetical protein A3A26_00465 [Candidatus Zambryskibacteria bacterium RIFCSPLOWO2_01_FULL_47_14]